MTQAHTRIPSTGPLRVFAGCPTALVDKFICPITYHGAKYDPDRNLYICRECPDNEKAPASPD